MLAAAVSGALAGSLALWFWPTSADTQASPATEQAVGLAPVLTAVPNAPALETQSYQSLLSKRSDDWRLTRLAENPKILVIEFPTLAAQGRALNRLAALIEKNKGPRDRVLSDEGLAKFIQQLGDTPETFYFGHDYTAEAVARFFTMAVSQQMLLNADELRLGNELLAAGLLKEESDKLIANPDRQAVVSFTAVQADDPLTKGDETVDERRREAILRHELSHGEFFTNAAYRQHCWNFWQQLSDNHRKLFTKFLTAQGYDPGNEELMVNETQAYLMHTPDPRAFSAEQLGVSPDQLTKLRAQFNQGLPQSIFSTIER
ncbi:MAG: hypothetical protein ABI564_09510 [Ideonella sp.]